MIRTGLLIIASAVILCSCGSKSEVGKSYKSYDDLINDQKAKGYVFLGRFGESWPAELTEVRTAVNEISFQRLGGIKHRYPGYDGYELKMIRLMSSSNEEIVIVVRSKEKQGT